MKISHLSIIFVFVFICFMIPHFYEADTVQAVTGRQIVYNQALDNAVADAVISLVERDSRQQIIVNKELARERFFASLYSTLGIMGGEKKKEMEGYIPVLLVTDTDGFYLYYQMELPDKTVYGNWTEKQPYEAVLQGRIFSFTLDDYLKIYDPATKQYMEGKYQDLAKVYPEERFLQNSQAYDQMRRDCIITRVKEQMKQAINHHNRIAGHFGISYNFTLPNISTEDWYRTIDDVSFMAVFQGYPYGHGPGYYNRYAVGGARIRKTDYFYLSSDGEGLWYHRSDCSVAKDMAKPFYSKEDCAKEGARACQVCSP